MGDDKLAEEREKKRAYNAAYYAAHREELLAYQAAYRAEHREERYAYGEAHREEQRAYREAHREEMCAYNAAYYRSLDDEQREDKRAYGRAYYYAHREDRRKREEWFRRWIDLLRSTQGCSDCGTHDGMLEYHHVDPATKRYNVSHMYGYSEEAFMDEVAKCVVLCRQCHRKRHAMLKEAV